MKMLVSKMPLVIGEFYETVLKPMALEKGGITAMTIVPWGTCGEDFAASHPLLYPGTAGRGRCERIR